MKTGPSNSAQWWWAGTIVSILTIPQSSQSKVSIPLEPASGLDLSTHVCVHEHGPGIFFPGPPQVSGLGGINITVQYWKSCPLVRIFSALGRDSDFLHRQGFPSEYLAILEYGGTVTEYEVDGAMNVAFAIELAEGVGIESVLVAFHAAPVKGRLIRVHPEGNGLVVLGAGRVSKCHISCYESFPRNSYNVTWKLEQFRIKLWSFAYKEIIKWPS